MITEETRTKMRRAQLGRRHPKEVRDKISRSHIGHPVSPETRRKLSCALKGKPVPPFSIEHRRKLSESNRRRRISLATRNKMSVSHLGIKRSATSVLASSVATRDLWKNPEWRAKTIEAQMQGRSKAAATERERVAKEKSLAQSANVLGILDAPAVPTKAPRSPAGLKISKARTGMRFSPQHCANIGKSKKTAWSNPEWRDRVVRLQRLGTRVHPNKAETMLFQLLEKEHPGEWRFVGDGSFVIGGKNPDYVNVNGKKALIELFGNYWHRGENPQERIDIFKQYGFSTLIIWEKELRNLDIVLDTIVQFQEACGNEAT